MVLRDLPEKRASTRLEGIALPVEYLLKEKGETFREGRAMGVGESGLTLALKEPLPVGTNLHLKLHIPSLSLAPFDWQTVPIDAKVVWIDDVSRPNQSRHYGTFFTQLSERDAASLKRYLQLARWMNDKVRDQ